MMQSTSFLRFYVGATHSCGVRGQQLIWFGRSNGWCRGSWLGGAPNTGSGVILTMVDPPKGGTGGTPTLMAMGGETMTGGIVQQNPCDRICGKYAECDRSAIGPGGREGVWPRVPHSMSCLRSTII